MKPYCMISNAKTFAFSAENPTGARAGGSKGGDCTKLSPTVAIRAGETVTLVDTDGPGMIQSIWFTGYIGHSFVIRMYWDNCEYPSVEAPISAFFGTAYDENFVDRDGKYAVLNSAQILTGTELLLGDAFQKALPDHHGKPWRKGSEPVLYHHRLSL